MPVRKKKFIIFIILCLPAGALFCQDWKIQAIPVQTRWAKEVSPQNALKEYPRPQMVRSNWQNLNGLWQYAIAKDASEPNNFKGQILVPYSIESALSGVKKMVQPSETLWYRKNISIPALKNGERVLLHFGAVDWETTVFINNKPMGTHTGGYDHFSFDITDALKKGINEIKVKVNDPSDQGYNPHGKQVLNPKDIWYTPTTGIWQTVWLETVPRIFISDIKLTSDIDKKSLFLEAKIDGASKGYSLSVMVSENGHEVATGTTRVEASQQQLTLPVISPHVWSPDAPFLYDIKIRLLDGMGNAVDEITSYFGMRKVEIKKDEKGFDRIFLNNKYVFNLGVLDQGFWPDGIYTAPTDEALSFDIRAIKSMGFNTIRKHIKREPDRWYYWCDKLGIMVWQDMVNPSFTLTDKAKKEFEKECKENIGELYNHPSITVYTLFNEKWGQYDQERLTKWIKQLDPTRLINGHSGEYLYVNEKLRSPSPNAYVESDITDVHSYPDPMTSIQINGKARVLGEFGGIGVFIPDHQWNVNSAWGYITVTPAALKGKYTIMNQHLKLLEREGLSASIYTQPFDVEGEQNGLMTYDREVVKIPFEELQKIHSQLVPTAGNLPQVIAQNADLTDPGIRYSQLLQQYIDGNKDISFLRRLVMAAQQAGDKPGITRATADYFTALKKPYSTEDFVSFLQVTDKTTGPGFALLKENAQNIDAILGERKAETKMMNIIYNELLAPSLTGQNPKPDWAELSTKVASFGVEGEEMFLRSKAIFYINQGDWNNFAVSADIYITNYGVHIKAEELNQFAWTVFARISDTNLLEKAIQWSKLSLTKSEQPKFMNTYANLLYKAGKKGEAITMEEKALNNSGGSEEFKNLLEKMKQGISTWE